MNAHQIAAEAAGEIVQSRYSHEDHFLVLTTNIIEAAIEKAYGAGLLDGASEVLNESRAAHGTSAVADASEK